MACGSEQNNETSSTEQAPKGMLFSNNPKRGDVVPNNLVCMVNDAYMGKKQIEVPFEGKMYYGCCNMCKERIPKDAKIRYAIDPYTLEKVDKATAYIVLIGDQGEVAYFENEASYRSFEKRRS
ncbi:hypothetical protein SAMN05660862_0957 [Sphingobacterium psychroaquaticum]|uniref:MlpB protein n=2 Tax=Sphingobacterium psychroaquaticum TaxID=561061 RepID=A0A1X7IL63_9SPHI|nr:hypothetical protein SAMN05660862_0957 [Sphingobacterium psychroaquaticum]